MGHDEKQKFVTPTALPMRAPLEKFKTAVDEGHGARFVLSRPFNIAQKFDMRIHGPALSMPDVF